jgi:hypothetical protein
MRIAILAASYFLFFVGEQDFATTQFGSPFPLPTLQERRAQQLKTRLEC